MLRVTWLNCVPLDADDRVGDELVLAGTSIGSGEGSGPPTILDLSLQTSSGFLDEPSAIPPTGGHLIESGRVKVERDDLGRLLIKLRINDSGPFTFLFDTGTANSVLSTMVALRLGLNLGGRTLVSFFTGRRAVRAATLERLEIGSLALSDIPVVVGDVGGLSGILGLDVIAAARTTLQVRENWLAMAASHSALARIGSSLASEPEAILTRGRVAQLPVTILIDTGAAVSVVNQTLVAAVNSSAFGAAEAREARLDSAFRSLGMAESRIELEVGGYRLSDLVVRLKGDQAFARFCPPNAAALILGMDALSAFDRLRIGDSAAAWNADAAHAPSHLTGDW